MKRILASATAILAGFSLVACSPPPPAEEPVRSVKLMKVQESTTTREESFAAEIRPAIESRLAFRVGGKILRRHVELGQHVKAGQLLAELDPADLSLANQAAAAQLQSAQTQRDLAKAELERYKGLRQQGFISAAELERREATAKAAESTLRQAVAQQSIQGNQSRYTHLLADADGLITSIDAEVGQVVSAGTPIVKLAKDGARDAVFAVAEDQIALIRPGQAAQVSLWAQGASSDASPALSGVVRELAAAADTVTRTYQVKVSLPEDQALPLGATASVRLQLGSTGSKTADPALAGTSIKVPTSALLRSTSEGKPVTQVWVFDAAQSIVSTRNVDIGQPQGNLIDITSGLKSGEEIVVAGVHVLSPGQKVIRYQNGPSAQGASTELGQQ